MEWISRGSTRDLVLFLAVSAGGLLLLGCPTSALEALPGGCLYRAVGFGSCPGCGMTHALSYALHGRWAEAFHANWRVVLVGPILVGMYLKLARGALRPSA